MLTNKGHSLNAVYGETASQLKSKALHQVSRNVYILLTVQRLFVNIMKSAFLFSIHTHLAFNLIQKGQLTMSKRCLCPQS